MIIHEKIHFVETGEMMAKKWLLALAILMVTSPAGAASETVLKTQQDRVNYGIGVSVAKNFQQQGMEVDVNLVVQGLKDQLEGKKLLMSDDKRRLPVGVTGFNQELPPLECHLPI